MAEGMEESLFASKPMSLRMDWRSPEAAKLREAVSKKLLNFLGNYSDDILTEYIVVLVCNGKHQIQARDDLQAFLGQDSEAFVAWLWDFISKEFISKMAPNIPYSESKVATNHSNIFDKDHGNSLLADKDSRSSGLLIIPSNSSRTVPSQCFLEPKIESAAIYLPFVIPEENQLSISSRENSAEIRLPSTDMDELPHQTSSFRRNVWDRLGRPREENQIPLKEEQSYHPGEQPQTSWLTNASADKIGDGGALKRKRETTEFHTNNEESKAIVVPQCKANKNPPMENLALTSTTLQTNSKAQRLTGGNANHNPVQDDVLSVKLRLQQIKMDVLKLRSNQAGRSADGKQKKPSGLQIPQAQSEEGLELRTVLVTNVHFAATREALLSNFGKCGTIAKVIILTDAFTSLPKGAAYIVFAKKESVEKAISLSGTSFFSRILKVIRKAEVPSDFMAPSPQAQKQQQPFISQSYGNVSMRKPHTRSSHLQWKREHNK